MFISFNNGTAIDSQNVTTIGVYSSVAYIPFDMSLLEVSYNASWENKTVTIFQNDIDRTNITNHNFGPVAFGGLINFTNVPRGENNIEFKVKKGAIIIDKENIPQTYQFASITKTEMLRFTVNNATVSSAAVNDAIGFITPATQYNLSKNIQTQDEQNLGYLLMLLIVFTLAILSFRFLHKRKQEQVSKVTK